MVDDADDASVDRRLDRIEREARLLAADEEHLFARAGADRVDGHQWTADGLAVGCEGLDDEQLDAGEVRVFPRGDNVADDAGELHGVSR